MTDLPKLRAIQVLIDKFLKPSAELSSRNHAYALLTFSLHECTNNLDDVEFVCAENYLITRDTMVDFGVELVNVLNERNEINVFTYFISKSNSPVNQLFLRRYDKKWWNKHGPSTDPTKLKAIQQLITTYLKPDTGLSSDDRALQLYSFSLKKKILFNSINDADRQMVCFEKDFKDKHTMINFAVELVNLLNERNEENIVTYHIHKIPDNRLFLRRYNKQWWDQNGPYAKPEDFEQHYRDVEGYDTDVGSSAEIIRKDMHNILLSFHRRLIALETSISNTSKHPPSSN